MLPPLPVLRTVTSSTVATFPWSPETGNADLMLQNINDGTFPALGMSTSLGWNESFLPEDYPSEYPSELLSYFSQTPEQHNYYTETAWSRRAAIAFTGSTTAVFI